MVDKWKTSTIAQSTIDGILTGESVETIEMTEIAATINDAMNVIVIGGMSVEDMTAETMIEVGIGGAVARIVASVEDYGRHLVTRMIGASVVAVLAREVVIGRGGIKTTHVSATNQAYLRYNRLNLNHKKKPLTKVINGATDIKRS